MAAKSKKRLVTGVIAGVLGCALVGYGVADAYDVVPEELGIPSLLTVKPQIEVQPVPDPRAEAIASAAPTSALDESSPVPANIAAAVDGALSDSKVKDLGIEVRDALSNEILYAKGENKARTPASVTKVLTGAAALTTIGGDKRLSTTVDLDPATKTLTLVGGGDSLLGAGESQPSAVNGRAGLTTLAQETAAALKKQNFAEVSLGLDLSRYPGKDFNDGWERNDIGKGIITPIHPLMIDSAYLGNKEWRARSENPGKDALGVFKKKLEEAGITVTEAAKDDTAAADGAAGRETIAAVESATISEIVEYALVHSDNVVAEVIGREVAIAAGEEGSMEAAPKAVLSSLEKTVDLGDTHLEDLSGLTYANKISPHDLTSLLQTSVVAKDSLSSLISFMPVGGLSGTLATRFVDDKAASGGVHAKTGTLSSVTSLAGGVLDANGRYLVFSLQVDGVEKGKTFEARSAIDKVVTALANCGCR